MSATIDDLLEQVQALKAAAQPANRDAEFQAMERELYRARCDADVARKERDAAVAELAKVRADAAWTMQGLRIADIMMLRGSKDMACAGEGFLPFDYDPEDTKRIEWINAHGRAGAGSEHWLISVPHHLTMEEHLPQPYNVRHILDLSRGVTYGPDGEVTGKAVAA